MYGMLLEAIQYHIQVCYLFLLVEFFIFYKEIQLEYGEELWKKVLKVSDCKHTVFNTHQIYSDNLVLEFGKACAQITGGSYEKFISYFGKCFIRFTSKFGY